LALKHLDTYDAMSTNERIQRPTDGFNLGKFRHVIHKKIYSEAPTLGRFP
jgi:hypothetical protein